MLLHLEHDGRPIIARLPIGARRIPAAGLDDERLEQRGQLAVERHVDDRAPHAHDAAHTVVGTRLHTPLSVESAKG